MYAAFIPDPATGQFLFADKCVYTRPGTTKARDWQRRWRVIESHKPRILGVRYEGGIPYYTRANGEPFHPVSRFEFVHRFRVGFSALGPVLGYEHTPDEDSLVLRPSKFKPGAGMAVVDIFPLSRSGEVLGDGSQSLIAYSPEGFFIRSGICITRPRVEPAGWCRVAVRWDAERMQMAVNGQAGPLGRAARLQIETLIVANTAHCRLLNLFLFPHDLGEARLRQMSQLDT